MLLSLETDTLELKKKPKTKPNKPNKHKMCCGHCPWEFRNMFVAYGKGLTYMDGHADIR